MFSKSIQCTWWNIELFSYHVSTTSAIEVQSAGTTPTVYVYMEQVIDLNSKEWHASLVIEAELLAYIRRSAVNGI